MGSISAAAFNGIKPSWCIFFMRSRILRNAAAQHTDLHQSGNQQSREFGLGAPFNSKSISNISSIQNKNRLEQT